MKRYKLLLTFCLTLLFSMQATAQNLQIYNGIMERGYPSAQYDNTPYFPEQFQKGKVTFKGYTYEDVLLKTDLSKGQLIIFSPGTGSSITYAPDEIERVEIGGIEYRYLESPAVGWYEVIAENSDWTFYRRNYISTTTREVRQQNMYTRFSPTQRIYLFKQGKWFAIGNINAFSKQFPEHKAEVKAYAKQHNLKFDTMEIATWQHFIEYIKEL